MSVTWAFVGWDDGEVLGDGLGVGVITLLYLREASFRGTRCLRVPFLAHYYYTAMPQSHVHLAAPASHIFGSINIYYIYYK